MAGKYWYYKKNLAICLDNKKQWSNKETRRLSILVLFLI